MDDTALINAIRENNYQKPLSRLYHYLPVVEKFIRANGGTPTEARDVFQEALVVFCRKAKQPDFQLTASLDTYLYSVCKYLWKDELKKKNKQLESKEASWNDLPVEPQEWIEEESKFQLAESAIAQLGKRCRDLLGLFYIKALSMVQIANKMSFSSAKIAKNQKYKCLEKARTYYREQQETKPLTTERS